LVSRDVTIAVRGFARAACHSHRIKAILQTEL